MRLSMLQVAIRKGLSLARKNLTQVAPGDGGARSDSSMIPVSLVSNVLMARTQSLILIASRIAALANEIYVDPIGVSSDFVPWWDLSWNGCSRILGTSPGSAGFDEAYADGSVLRFLIIQARLHGDMARDRVHGLIRCYRELGGQVPQADGLEIDEQVRVLPAKAPLGRALTAEDLGALTDTWLAPVSDVLRQGKDNARAAHKRERWLRDDALRFRAVLEARQASLLRRWKLEARRVDRQCARLKVRLDGLDARVSRRP